MQGDDDEFDFGAFSKEQSQPNGHRMGMRPENNGNEHGFGVESKAVASACELNDFGLFVDKKSSDMSVVSAAAVRNDLSMPRDCGDASNSTTEPLQEPAKAHVATQKKENFGKLGSAEIRNDAEVSIYEENHRRISDVYDFSIAEAANSAGSGTSDLASEGGQTSRDATATPDSSSGGGYDTAKQGETDFGGFICTDTAPNTEAPAYSDNTSRDFETATGNTSALRLATTTTIEGGLVKGQSVARKAGLELDRVGNNVTATAEEVVFGGVDDFNDLNVPGRADAAPCSSFLDAGPLQPPTEGTKELSRISCHQPPSAPKLSVSFSPRPSQMKEVDPTLQKAKIVFSKVFESYKAEKSIRISTISPSEAMSVADLMSSIGSDSRSSSTDTLAASFHEIMHEFPRTESPPLFITKESKRFAPDAPYRLPIGCWSFAERSARTGSTAQPPSVSAGSTAQLHLRQLGRSCTIQSQQLGAHVPQNTNPSKSAKKEVCGLGQQVPVKASSLVRRIPDVSFMIQSELLFMK